jgi:hypothetical protein
VAARRAWVLNGTESEPVWHVYGTDGVRVVRQPQPQPGEMGTELHFSGGESERAKGIEPS